MSSNFESRLRQQLSLKALELPEKPNRLGKVRATARRRLVLSRAAVSIATLAGVVAFAGLASVALQSPGDPTYAAGGAADSDDEPSNEESTTLNVEQTTTSQAPSTDEATPSSEYSSGADAAETAADGWTEDTTASFGNDCLPAPALADVSVTDPGKQVIRISTEAELQQAARNLSPNTVLLLAPGTYELSRTLWVSVDDVTIRGDSTRCDDVVLVGKGMENAAGKDDVPHGVWTDRSNLKVQNLTIRDVYFHAITVNGGGYAPEIYNVQLVDSGEQFIKINPIGFGEGVDDGVVNYAAIKYTDAAPITDHGGGTGYTQGVDIHAGDGWTIKNSRFENLHTPDDADHLWGPAILVWNGASNTTVEANIFIDVNRAIAFGLDGSRQEDHSGGVIRNNMIVMRPGLYSDRRVAQSDASIIVWNSPGTEVLHNTVATQGNTAKSIELRFDSDGAVIRNNLVDAPITDRDSSQYVDANNVRIDDISMFRDPTVGDLHLTGSVEAVVDSAPTIDAALHDFDGHRRDGSGGSDAGADEFVGTTPVTPPTSERPTSTPSTDPTSTSSPTIGPSTTGRSTTKKRPKRRPSTSTTTSTRPPRTQPPTTKTPTTQTPTTQTPTTQRPTVQPPKPVPGGSGDRVTEADFQYQGSFRVPDRTGNDERSTLAWGGAGLGYNEANNSLFITGHSWHQLTAEISIPDLGRSSNVSALPQARFLQSLQDVTDGKLPTVSQPRTDSYGRIGGYLVDGDDLIVSGYHYYDAAGEQDRSHLLTDTNMGSSSNMLSLSDEVDARWLGGAMAVIPDEWRDDFGGDPFIGGLAGISIVSNSSVGPAAATFSKASLQGRDPAELVLGYPLAEPLDGPTTKSELWNLTSEVRGMVFPSDTSSVLYFGTHGVGEYCYGTGSACGDPASDSKGTHAYPYRYQVWAYDAADLANVYSGGAAAKSVQPYDYWKLDLPYSPRQTVMGGAAYDPATGRIFISQGFADGDQPVIHVYTLR